MRVLLRLASYGSKLLSFRRRYFQTSSLRRIQEEAGSRRSSASYVRLSCGGLQGAVRNFQLPAQDIEFRACTQSRRGVTYYGAARHGKVSSNTSPGKWTDLSTNYPQMLAESNLTDTRTAKLVDQPGNGNDIVLWSIILDFTRRRLGSDGVYLIWQGIYQRRKLYDVNGPAAREFWITILRTALDRPSMLEDVISHADWMLQKHDAAWPELYTSVVEHFLNSDSAGNAAEWHRRLAPSYGLDPWSFAAFLKAHVADERSSVQASLQAIYKLSTHRSIYDAIIPHLRETGHAVLADDWDVFLSEHGDSSSIFAPRSAPQVVVTAGQSEAQSPKSPEFGLGRGGEKTQSLRHTLNEAYGRVFGIHEKNYNDRFGARWLATSWISLDFAIKTLSGMGVSAIGPLSMQSIALREDEPQKLSQHFTDLTRMGIDVGQAVYTQVLRSFAVSQNAELLQILLHADIHPDVYEDMRLREAVKEQSLSREDWNTYRLLLAVDLILAENIAVLTSNLVIQSYARMGLIQQLSTAIADQAAKRMELSVESCQAVSGCILRSFSSSHLGLSKEAYRLRDENIATYMLLAQQIASSRFPPPTEVWQVLLLHFTKRHDFESLERLALEIARMYASDDDVPVLLSNTTMLVQQQDMAHKFDPTDEPHGPQAFSPSKPDNDKRPVTRQVFTPQIQHQIILSAFRSELSRGNPMKKRKTYSLTRPEDFAFARGVRLLALLRQLKVGISEHVVQNTVLGHLVQLYGTGPLDYRGHILKRRNLLTLAEAKRLFDAAWGQQLTPPYAELVKVIREKSRKGEIAFLRHRGDSHAHTSRTFEERLESRRNYVKSRRHVVGAISRKIGLDDDGLYL